MSNRNEHGFFTGWEEAMNTITHGIGAGLSIAALVILIVASAQHGTPWHVVGFTIFGSMLVLLYMASTLYHGVQQVRAKEILRKFDQGAIFLLIAGSYTPFLLTVLRGPWGWSLFGVIWALAIYGIISRFLQGGTVPKGGLVVYILMGWLVVVALKPLIAAAPLSSLIWLLIGGVAYTTGVIFYAWERLPFGHAVWHLFVMAGSISHFFAVLNML
jgi:hemolysin III